MTGPEGTEGRATDGREGHRGRWLLGLAALVVVLVAAVVVVVVASDDEGGDDDGGGGRAEAPESWDPDVEPIAAWVAEERGLEFEHPVEVRLLSDEEYRERAEEDEGGEEAAEEAREAEDALGLLRALGLVTGDVDLEAAGEDLVGEGSAAVYSDEDEVVYVRGEELTPAVRVTVAHELTHALQDQHFDLSRIREDDDVAAGVRSVSEGDANRIEAEYAQEELSADEREAYEAEAEESGAEADEGLADVPPALVALFTAPYALGEGYIATLDGENTEIDDALRDPPTEQELLDPAARGTDRAEPVEVEAPEAPDGAEVVDEDTFGPVAWFLLLAARGAPDDALATVDGWGGDAFVSYRQDDRLCTDVVVAGDDAEATEAFRTALDAWAAGDPAGNATIEAVDDAVRLRSCDSGADAAPVGEVSPDVVSLPLVRAQIEAELQGSFSASPEEARCASTRILDELSLEQLTGEGLAPEDAERIQALAEECRA